MTYNEFEQTTLALLNAQAVGTWIRLGSGFLGVVGGNALLCVPEPAHTVPDMLAFIEGNFALTDVNAWNGDAFDGMTSEVIEAAFANPEFHLFGVPDGAWVNVSNEAEPATIVESI